MKAINAKIHQIFSFIYLIFKPHRPIKLPSQGGKLKLCFLQLIFTTLFCLGSEDVKTVKNGRALDHKPNILKLTETLRVGPGQNSDERFIWAGPHVAVEVNAAGHMFVVDSKSNRIIELDQEGRFVRQIGRSGEGPGEFQALKKLQFLDDGTAVVFEAKQSTVIFNFFDADFKFQNRQTPTGTGMTIQRATLSPDGRRMGTASVIYDFTANTLRYKEHILNREFQPEMEISERLAPIFDREKVQDPNYWSQYLAAVFKSGIEGSSGFYTFDHLGNAYTAIARDYQITKWDPNLKKTLVISRDYKPIPLTEAEIEATTEPMREAIIASLPTSLQSIITKNVLKRAVELAEFPTYKLPVMHLSTLPDGKLLVIHNFSFETEEATADIFTSEGKWIGSLTHGNLGLFSGAIMRMVFKGKEAYCIESDDNGDNVLVRYQMTAAPMEGGG